MVTSPLIRPAISWGGGIGGGALKHLETIVTDSGVLEFPEEAMEDEALEAAVQTMSLGRSKPRRFFKSPDR